MFLLKTFPTDTVKQSCLSSLLPFHPGVCVCVRACVRVFFLDLLFGLPGKYTGVSHYNRRRVVTYTITVVLSRYDAG